MNVSRINQHNIELDRLERTNHQRKIEEDYRKVIEKKNMRLDRDKGRNIDVEV